ncbi:hypothetical protein, partial [Streptomyces sp. H39-C1]|uniref:hypothetical protein n=1 Tax=Streptomyces sp. H39-C1 TaxID=3004355 RepID=UPI0022AEA3F5
QTRDPSKEVLEPRRPDLNVPLRLHALTNDSPDQQARTAPVVPALIAAELIRRFVGAFLTKDH